MFEAEQLERAAVQVAHVGNAADRHDEGADRAEDGHGLGSMMW